MTSGPQHRIAALTGLRAVAALMVVGTHAFFWTGNYTEDAFGYFGARLESGVALFFALSGYLLFRRWVHSQRTGAPLPATWRYLRRRARRILPAYWIVVTVVYLVYLVRDAGPFGRGWSGYLRNMTLTQIYGYGHAHESLTQMWSIAVEASFYLLLPVAGWAITVLICRRKPAPRRVLVFVVLLAAMSPLWIWATHSDGFYALPGIDAAGVDVTAQLWLPSFFAWFAGGMALAVIEPELRDRGWLDPGSGRVRRIRGVSTGACLLVAGGAYAASCTSFAGTGTIMPADLSQSLTKNALYTIFATAALAPLVLTGTGLPPLALRAIPRLTADRLARRDLLRDLLDPPARDGPDDGRRRLPAIPRVDIHPVRGDGHHHRPPRLAAGAAHSAQAGTPATHAPPAITRRPISTAPASRRRKLLEHRVRLR